MSVSAATIRRSLSIAIRDHNLEEVERLARLDPEAVNHAHFAFPICCFFYKDFECIRIMLPYMRLRGHSGKRVLAACLEDGNRDWAAPVFMQCEPRYILEHLFQLFEKR